MLSDTLPTRRRRRKMNEIFFFEMVEQQHRVIHCCCLPKNESNSRMKFTGGRSVQHVECTMKRKCTHEHVVESIRETMMRMQFEFDGVDDEIENVLRVDGEVGGN